MTIYVSNLNLQVESEHLKKLFVPYGEVNAALVMRDKMSNRSRGFGFVEMKEDAEGNEAISKLNGQMIEGRILMVNESKPKERSYL